MDFDDLDEEISKRVQEGEVMLPCMAAVIDEKLPSTVPICQAVAGNFVENRQPVKGTVLPKMRRTAKRTSRL